MYLLNVLKDSSSSFHIHALISFERQHYYKHRDLAKRSKRDCMSVIIDGMDQAKTNIPHFTRERKCRQGLWRLRNDFFPIEYLISRFECKDAYDPLCLQVLIQLVQAYNYSYKIYSAY